MSKYCFILLAFSCIAGTLKAQGTDPVQHAANMLPPSPTASELGKYGLVPVGLSTGTANVTIPLHTYVSKNLSIPLSLNYSSNGIKVDQIATWVGLAWSLDAGGVITRIIRDEADREGAIPYPQSFGQQSIEGIKYLELADSYNTFDSEVDLFTFNFSGHAGKFIFDRSGALVIMPHQNLKIERVIDPSPEGGFFKITTPDGVQYTFGAPEFSRSHNDGTGCGKTYDVMKETAWYLTKIEHPAGDVIHFEYAEPHTYSYAASVSQNVTKYLRTEANCGDIPACPDFDWPQTCKSIVTVWGRRLQRIYGGFGEVSFDASLGRADIDDYGLNNILVKDASGTLIKSFNFQYAFSPTDYSPGTEDPYKTARRMFLNRLQEKDGIGKAIKEHFFEYEDINGLPPRLSYAQDHWGYFNGASNDYFVPVDNTGRVDHAGRKIFEGIGGNREPNSDFSKKGILKKIVYPTGGTSEFFYDANTYSGTKTIYPTPQPILVQANGPGTGTFSLYNVYTQKILVTGSASLEDGHEPDPTHNKYTITVTDVTTGNIMVSEVKSLGESFFAEISLVRDHEYRFEVTAGLFTLAGLSTQYYTEPPSTVQANIETGGSRIGKIRSYDPVTAKSEDINYIYSKFSTPGVSSGVIRPAIIYYGGSTIRQRCSITGTYSDCLYGTLYSSSQNSLYPVNGNNIYYSHVVVSRGNDHSYGAEEHEFIINFDVNGNPVWGTEDIISAPLTNAGWNNGLEKAVTYYKKSGSGLTKIKYISNNYVSDPRNQKEVASLVVRRKYDPVMNLSVTVPCDESNRTKQYFDYTCVAGNNNNHNHSWYLGGDPRRNGHTRCIAPGNDNKWVVTGAHPCYGKPAEVEEVVIPYALDHLDAVEYKNIAYWHYLQSTVETTYDEQGQNPVTVVTEYAYDNPVHSQLSKLKTTRSDGRIAETSVKYLEDYTNLEGQSVLLDKYIVSSPIKTESLVGGNLVGGKVIKYNDRGQPLEIYEYESAVLKAPPVHNNQQLVPSGDFKLKATLTYEANANLSEVHTSSLPKISYRWGYGGTRVIAKASGAGAADIFHTSFEDDGQQGAAKTGERYLNSGTYTVSTAMFNPVATNLVMSYWYWQDNAWNFSGEVPFVRTINAGTQLDEIRIYPKGSQLTTITYDTHHNQVKTMTDSNNITTHYEYDNLGRLLRIRDEQNNIVTEQKYHHYNND